MFTKTLGYFLARWDMAKYVADLSIENLELQAKNDELADLAWEQRRETDLFKRRLHAMHRRAQRAEATKARDVAALRDMYERSHWLARTNAETFRAKFEAAYADLRRVYPHLHYAWLAYMTDKYSNSKAANEISALEADLRRRYDKITTPPQPESFSKGDTDVSLQQSVSGDPRTLGDVS